MNYTMQLGNFLLIVVSVLLVNAITAQSPKVYIPEWNGQGTKYFYDKNVKEILDSMDSLLSLKEDMPRYSFRKGAALISIINAYSNIKAHPDTIYQYARIASNTSLNRFCYYWDFFLRRVVIEDGKKEIYFKNERPLLWEEYCEKCRIYYENLEAEKKATISYSAYFEALQLIGERDKKHRVQKEIEWSAQNYLDSLNRVALDSLYELYGFPSKKVLGGRTSLVPWYVMQHSTDCDWLEKWIGYYLDAKMEKKGNIRVPLNATFIRFFHPETGYCDNRKVFIQYLKKNYPSDFAEKFGYRDFD